MSTPETSVIVTSRNRCAMLLRCLQSIANSDYRDFELIVIDDASTDGTEKLVDSDFHNIQARIIHLEEQVMMVKARNLGASHAQGRYLIMIDDDNIVPPDMLSKLVEALDKNPEYGILGPVIHYYSTRSLIMCGQKINMYTGKTKGFTDLGDTLIKDSDGIPNAFAIRKSVFEEVKGFDASIIQTFTEPDFAFQAQRQGHKCGFVTSAKIYHDIPFKGQFTPRSLGNTYVQKAYCLMRNRTVMVARYGSLFQKIIYSLVFSWFWPLIYSLIMLRWRKTEVLSFYWMGFIDGWRYMLTGKLHSSLPSLLLKHKKM